MSPHILAVDKVVLGEYLLLEDPKYFLVGGSLQSLLDLREGAKEVFVPGSLADLVEAM